MTEYTVDFESVTIDEETYEKLMSDKDYLLQWVRDNASIDQIIKNK